MTRFTTIKQAAFALAFLASTSLTGCSKDSDSGSGSTSNTPSDIENPSTSNGTPEGNTDTGANPDDLPANSTFSKVVKIDFGTAVTITNPYSGSGVTITETNGDVVVTSTIKEVEYVLSGTTTGGSFKIYSDNKFKLTLNGVTIANNDGPAINIQSKKRVFIELKDGTNNTLSDASSYAIAPNDEDMKGTIFSEGQFIIYGTGTLNVAGKNKHAICSDDYIRIISGNINITSSVSDGIHTNDSFIMDGGTLTIIAGSDGIECEEGTIFINDGNLTISAADDGIAASYNTDTTIDPYVNINGGTISIKTTTGEGIESKSTLTINNGTITINTADDGLNAGKAIYINNGKIYVNSTGNDAIDSNGTLTITGGIVIAIGTNAPEAGFDCDNNQFKITGGAVIGLAGTTSTPTASVCTQNVVVLGSYTNNGLLHIESTDGKGIITFQVPRSYATMLLSTAGLDKSTTYNVYTGGSVSNGNSFNGLYLSGTYSGGSKAGSFSTSGVVTQVGGSTGPGGGGMGGRP